MNKGFFEGARVRMTPEAIRQGLHKAGRLPIKPSDTGTIISICDDGLVRILRDHRKDIRKYSPDFWELDTKEEE